MTLLNCSSLWSLAANTGLIIHSAETILRLFFLMTNNWIIETLAMRFARTDDLFAALLQALRLKADRQRAAVKMSRTVKIMSQ
jgi:hypothetical protein